MSSPPLPPGPFDVIHADPPWHFKSNSKARPGKNPLRHYNCMDLADVEAMPIASIVKDNAVLFLWITGPMLAIGAHLGVMYAWGFKPSGMGFTWIKTKKLFRGDKLSESDLHFGSGFTTRKNAEFCLIGKRGRSLRANAGVREVIISPVREHSRKPDEVFRRIEAYTEPGVNRLDLFGRESRPGWTVWGNQADKFDEV